MNWTNNSEEMIKEWAMKKNSEEKTENIFTKINSNDKSYWTLYKEEEEIMEYDFETIPEFLTVAKRYFNGEDMEEILKSVAVAAIKNRPVTDSNSTTNSITNLTDSQDLQIPEYRYVF